METGRNKLLLSWQEVDSLVEELTSKIESKNTTIDSVYGLPRGGLIPAVMLSHRLGVPLLNDPSLIGPNTLIVDDIVDSGYSLKEFKDYLTACLIYKPLSSNFIPDLLGRKLLSDDWIVFPWERPDSITLPDRENS